MKRIDKKYDNEMRYLQGSLRNSILLSAVANPVM
jgi:hypothetical protein